MQIYKDNFRRTIKYCEHRLINKRLSVGAFPIAIGTGLRALVGLQNTACTQHISLPRSRASAGLAMRIVSPSYRTPP